ncbi:cellulose biosynthesis protein BcsG [Chromobacterium phragmitis]|uniref:Cellulose biosynthesis protein BcsG n=1 Tax=Chromobacterium phragmitis TaxID=2202141 RepID=A0A344UDS2_9NEIS|nr:cellulose biosynthesis protein BcsG [Chromobacterium phragmitis]AXE33420.1 cellulose biosynthesis protein BcsG [Chromobacterium phragmitis]
MSPPHAPAGPKPPLSQPPAGLGGWSLYFILKLLLEWKGSLSLHPLPNLAFALLLLLPLSKRWLRLARSALAWPAALALLYYDSWLPPPAALWQQLSELKGFSFSYLAELAGRVLTPQLLTGLTIALAGYLLMSRILRLGTLVMAALLFLCGRQLWQESRPALPIAAVTASAGAAYAAQTPDQQLDNFYRTEQQRQVSFQGPLADPGFDVLLLHVCSLSWDDLKAIGFDKHPLLDRFDIVFDHFNSAASYSGPAALRVLRASCGQPRHAALYESAPEQCFLFQDLARLGFKTELALNHDGSFDSFLQQVRHNGRMELPLTSQSGVPVGLRGFDSSPIYNDYAMLSRWLQLRMEDGSPHVATYYNSISLHDGNRIPEAPTLDTDASYKYRADHLFRDIGQFIDLLEREHRKTILLLVPEHGAALRGDKLQFSGLREIPSPGITTVPAAIKVIGGKSHPRPIRIEQQVSYTAVSTILSRMLAQSPFGADYRPESYAQDLPITPFVSESANFTVMQRGNNYLLQPGGSAWSDYPM